MSKALGASAPGEPASTLPRQMLGPLSLLRSAEWKVKTDTDGIVLSLAPSPWCDKLATRCELFISSVRARHAAAVLTDDPRGDNKQSSIWQWDRLLVKRTILKTADNGDVLFHHSYKTPVWGVAPREVVLVQRSLSLTPEQQREAGFVTEVPDGAVFVSCSESVGAPHAPPADDAFTRAAVHAYMLVIVDEPGGVRVTQISSIDPLGWLPAILVNLSHDEEYAKLTTMRRLFAEELLKDSK